MELIDFKKYCDDFTWDYKLHFPIPTLRYIKNRIGQDGSERYDTSEITGFIVSVCRVAKNYLFKDTLTYERQLYEYQIAHDINLLYEVLEFVMEFFVVALGSGGLDKLYELQTAKQMKIPALENAYHNLALYKRPRSYQIRSFYDGY